MQVSLTGFAICAGLLVVGYCLRATLIVALMGSLAFGSTAVGTLTALGGSSPLAFTFIAVILLLFVVLRKTTWAELALVFARCRAAWIALGLTFYVCVSAVVLPRLLAGCTSAFVPVRGLIIEVPLGPVAGNITQTSYFVLGVLTFLALSALLRHRAYLKKIHQGFFVLCIFHAALGLTDFIGKLLGAGDVLMPIRTASYALLTEAEEAGFSRIVGGYSEASAFGSATLATLAFAFTYWRKTRSLLALALSVILLGLLLLCTSTTAYVGAVIISAPLILALARSMLAGRYSREDFTLFALALVTVMVALSIYLHDDRQFVPFVRLFESTVLDKHLSASAQERINWNLVSLQSFIDTGAMGMGFGSSRASSWPIAVISQIGLLGSLLMAALVMELARGIGRPSFSQVDPEMGALHDSARACALAGLVGASIAGGSADPGLLFFVGLAVVFACRTQCERSFLKVTTHALRRYDSVVAH
jgi:hypothetical protein